MWPILSHFMSNRYAVKSKIRLLIELYNLLTCAPLGGHSLSTQAPQKGHSLTSCLRKGGRIDSTSSVHLSISLSVRPSVRPSTFGHFRPHVCPITAQFRSLSATLGPVSARLQPNLGHFRPFSEICWNKIGSLGAEQSADKVRTNLASCSRED